MVLICLQCSENTICSLTLQSIHSIFFKSFFAGEYRSWELEYYSREISPNRVSCFTFLINFLYQWWVIKYCFIYVFHYIIAHYCYRNIFFLYSWSKTIVCPSNKLHWCWRCLDRRCTAATTGYCIWNIIFINHQWHPYQLFFFFFRQKMKELFIFALFKKQEPCNGQETK